YIVGVSALALLIGLFVAIKLKRKSKGDKVRSVLGVSRGRVRAVTVRTTQVVDDPINNHRVIELQRNLLLKALGNESVVERLVAFERTRNPDGDHTQWLEAAIRRWEHDNDRR